ncbi:cation diffusion facilitator family transporter [Anseongella ginsenosidimutans]|uniref:Cation diffusion facilitator family transporter n=1 Tax=Anseongella ginsenosidimutans TaxID=496056 RepID=A0A4R3KZX2_9SPHI|nr:cation diffusion facilitator family transporter [Anseongella ginsenosidimutans]QEC51149.1 cation transporter [Anseongella ginsenosidimutans]TCS90180.1 cation diffusion facilitator family transporter [Anseongella ginsenosidimutans]
MENANRQRILWISLSLGMSLLFCVLKFTGWYLTGSRSILTDALESIINVIATAFALYSVYLASKPKDRNHPYGHGKIEFFSAGFEGGLVLIAGVFILIGSIEVIQSPRQLESLNWGVAIITVSLAGNLLMGIKLVRKGKELNSLTLYADGKHLLSDCYSSGVLIAGLLIIRFTEWYLLDSLLSIALALVIIFNGYRLVRKSLSGLMDEADEKILEKIAELLNANRDPRWIDVHNLRVQRYGPDLHIDCHLTMPRELTFEEAHAEIGRFEQLLENSFEGHVEVFVHADPAAHKADMERPWTIRDIVTNKRHG